MKVRRSATVLAVLSLALLAPAGPASGKGVSGATVCGADGCHEVTDHALMTPLAEGGPAASPPRERGGFYRVRIEIHAEDVRDRYEVAALPEQGMMRAADGTWMRMSEAGASALARAVRTLEPFPADELPRDPGARAAEVVEPPAPDGSGEPPWPAIAIGGLALGSGLGLLAALRRRRRASPRARPSES